MRYVKLHHDRLQAPLIENVKVCLVLGAKLRPDNSLSPILQLRVRLVSILANAYPDWTFYISGCRADTSVIYRTLVEEYHIPEERFVLDNPILHPDQQFPHRPFAAHCPMAGL